ncbi:hypothetical protein QQF64_009371 [Cirrhinus molitorella]|uniref:Uncharacterized protein n=1 Tax=Cirrhinus molitorella TaxID=172907 RepID=A0ABR3M4D3_9TELE
MRADRLNERQIISGERCSLRSRPHGAEVSRENTDRGLNCSSAAMCLLKPQQTFLFLNELSSSSHYSANSRVKPGAADMKLAGRC